MALKTIIIKGAKTALNFLIVGTEQWSIIIHKLPTDVQMESKVL